MTAIDAPVDRLVAKRLYGAYAVEHFVDARGDIGDAVLADARQTPDPMAEQPDRHDDQRYTDQHQQGELQAGDQQHHDAADDQKQVADR